MTMKPDDKIAVETGRTAAPTMELRWYRENLYADSVLQQKWVCAEDGTSEWRELETVTGSMKPVQTAHDECLAFDRLRTCTAAVAVCDTAKICPEARFVEDLHFEDVDLIEVQIEIELEFGVDVHEEPGDLIMVKDYIELLKAKGVYHGREGDR
jgi:acyl carrier protein